MNHFINYKSHSTIRSHKLAVRKLLFIVSFILLLTVFSTSASAQTLLDPSFDGDGIVTTQFLSVSSKAYDSILQPDGKIIAVGSADASLTFPGSYQLVVFRYNPDGSLDTTFDGDGKFTFTPNTTKPSEALAAALQTDGKIVVVGNTGTAQNANQDAIVLRINSDGSMDTTFDGDGIKIINFDVQNANDTATDVAIQSDGKIVIADRTNGFRLQRFCRCPVQFRRII